MAQSCSRFAVERNDALAHIDDQNDYVGGFDGEPDLAERRLRDDILRFFTPQQTYTAGVHQGERATVPFPLGADAVARHAGLIVHNGDAPAHNAVEQRRLADIWATDDGD